MKWRSVLAIFLFIALVFSGCGGLQRFNSIAVLGLYSGNEFKLKVSNKRYHVPTTDGMFFSYKSLGEKQLKKRLRESDSIHLYAELSGWVIDRDNGDGTHDFFCMYSVAPSASFLTNMGAIIVSEHGKSLLSIPLHLVSDGRIRGTADLPTVYEGVEYETSVINGDANAGIEEFLAFYDYAGWFNIEQDGDKLVISSYKNNPSRALTEGYEFESHFPIEIHFTEHYGRQFFKFVYGQ